MKILVTGGAGYVGSHTCKALANAGHEAAVFDDLSTGRREFVRWGELIHGNIMDYELLRATLKKLRPDGVIHFAAKSQVGESVIDPGQYFRNNVGGTLALLEAMRDENVCNIVVSGTCAVYGQPDAVPITEAESTKPISPYGAAKLFMERMLADFERAHGLRWMSLRYFNAAGSSPQGEIGELHYPETHLIPRVMYAALGVLPKLGVYGLDYPTPDGSCIRDYIHVDDLAQAHISAMEKLAAGAPSDCVNLGRGEGSSVLEIIRGVEKLAGKPVPIVREQRRAGDPPCLVADASKAARVLGWQARKNLDAILEDAWNFTSAHRDMLRA